MRRGRSWWTGVGVRERAVPTLLWRVVLTGLTVMAVFAMHGPSAGSGCAAGDPMSAGGSAAAMMNTTPYATMASAVPDVLAPPVRDGQVCLSTPPRLVTAGLLLVVLLAALLAPALVVRPPVAAGFEYRRRAPPLTGTALLRHLCVSRT
jgi:hypothetical protein